MSIWKKHSVQQLHVWGRCSAWLSLPSLSPLHGRPGGLSLGLQFAQGRASRFKWLFRLVLLWTFQCFCYKNTERIMQTMSLNFINKVLIPHGELCVHPSAPTCPRGPQSCPGRCCSCYFLARERPGLPVVLTRLRSLVWGKARDAAPCGCVIMA